MALKRLRSSTRTGTDRASTRSSPDRASARCKKARGKHAGGDQFCHLQCCGIPELFSFLDGSDIVRLLATRQDMYSGCPLDGAWEWVKRNYERHLKVDALRLGGLRLGAVVMELHFWEKKVGTYTLSAPLARSFALAALQDLSGSEEGWASAASQLAANLQVSARRELWCTLEAEDSDSDQDTAEDEVLMACDQDIGAYGKVSQKLFGSARLFGYEFALAAECLAEVSSGCFACWEDGAVKCRRHTRALGKTSAEELLAWSGRSGDAACDEDGDDDHHHAVTHAPANAIQPLARRLGVDARALTRLVLAVLASPFRLAGPPHAYAFDLDWERRLNELWNSP